MNCARAGWLTKGQQTCICALPEIIFLRRMLHGLQGSARRPQSCRRSVACSVRCRIRGRSLLSTIALVRISVRGRIALVVRTVVSLVRRLAGSSSLPRNESTAWRCLSGRSASCLWRSQELARRLRTWLHCFSLSSANFTPDGCAIYSVSEFRYLDDVLSDRGGSVAEWLACWTQAQ